MYVYCTTQIKYCWCLLLNKSQFGIITVWLFCFWKTNNKETNLSCLNNWTKQFFRQRVMLRD